MGRITDGRTLLSPPHTSRPKDAQRTGEQYLYSYKWHAFGAPGRPALAGLRAWAQGPPRESVGQARDSRRRRLGPPGSLAAAGAAAQARCLSVGTHGAGRRRSAVPPHPPPGGPRRHAPRLTALAEPSGRPPAPGMLSPGKMRNAPASSRGPEQRCVTVVGQEAAIAPHHGRGCPATLGRQVLNGIQARDVR